MTLTTKSEKGKRCMQRVYTSSVNATVAGSR